MRQLIGIEDVPWPSEEVALTRYERRVGRHIVELRLLAQMIAPLIAAACLILVPTFLTNYFAVLLAMWPSAFVANYAGLAVARGNGGSIEFLAVPTGGRVAMPDGRMPLRVLRSMMIFGQAFQLGTWPVRPSGRHSKASTRPTTSPGCRSKRASRCWTR